ncbi:MAG: SAM-dependent methyltransferase [Hydrogenophilales bacterium CG17_big_fil_post_rev_8_21_14_2_50_63_12]|nr:MAG: SAM-dependent methyltransferase [Hydrogenophilales bacterium CG17_big_fil_post_rev_8_21_14_2_50_63_12]PIX95985.1 MAG: SAM-dependent methyltransferase [Hydrogenophilales bacterium CG_4_10_14_3_um_filter_63_21]PJB02622.1 MAG: SAM-dependent methyltransferase [Hydrogenophilales bacterium CG_4_9_14_3_um_filter_63_34]
MIPLLNMNASAWVQRWAALIPPGGRVLDLACGGGRHAVYLAGLGHGVIAVDRDLSLATVVRGTPGITWRQADLEADAWPFPGGSFRGIVITHYLHRPLFGLLLAALEPGGVLIYETFSLGQAKYGRPRNPAHLLLPGELLEITRGKLRVLAFEDVEEPEQRRCVQRLCGVKA